MTTEEKLQLARKRNIYTEYELSVLWRSFLQNLDKFTINKNKQLRHIAGSKEFTFFDDRSKLEGKAGYSFFFPDFNIHAELPQLIGTGILEFENGIPKRETVKCSCNVGLGGREKLVTTNVLSIRYSSTGFHAFPVHPNVYDDIVKKLKKKNRQARFTASCRSVLVGFFYNIHSFLKKVKKGLKSRILKQLFPFILAVKIFIQINHI